MAEVGYAQAIDPAVEQAHAHVLALFRRDPAPHSAGLDAVCRAARVRLGAMPVLDPRDPGTWPSYRLITTDVQTVLAYLRVTGVPSSEPESFRSLLIGVLRYLHEADEQKLGALLAETVLRDWAARLGESHPHTLEAAERLAVCLDAQGDSERAKPLFESVFALRAMKLGDDDPATLLAACNLGACLNRLADHQAALRLNNATVWRCERRLGKYDGTTILAAGNLAGSLSGLGEHRTALTMYREIAQRHRRVSGDNSLATLDAEANVAITLHRLGDHEAARAADADLLPRFEDTAGKDYSGTQLTCGRLEMNLRALGREEEADEVHDGRAGRRQGSPAARPVKGEGRSGGREGQLTSVVSRR